MTAVKSVPARVLISDDSIAHNGVLVILLENAGYDVISLCDGRRAIQALRDEVFDLAILDHDTAGMSSLDILTELRGFRPELPVIVCGTVTADQAARYAELGIDHLLPKPVDPLALRDRIVDTFVRRHPNFDSHRLAAPSFRVPLSTPTTPVLHSPIAAGVSKFARKLQTDLQRLRDFKSLAILEGPVGSGRFEIAISLAPSANVHTFVCHADEFTSDHFDRLLKPAAKDANPVFFVMLEADRLDTDRQAFIEDLLCGRVENHASLARRLRMVLCAQTSLCDLHFNELLLMRAVTATVRLPLFADRWMDWAAISRSILSRIGSGRSVFDPEAIRWINRYVWKGDYMQLHRTIELARRRAGIEPVITIAHLEHAVAMEAACNEPLVHDLLFHVHSGG